MQRRGWIGLVGVLLLVGVAFYFMRSRGGVARSSGELPRVTDPSSGEGGGDVGAQVLEGPASPGTRRSRRTRTDDGGIAVAHVGLQTESLGEGTASRGLPRSDPDANRSAGWRLGRSRRRISILQDRVGAYQAAVDRFVAEGRPDVADRQRAVLERVQRRVLEFQEEEGELLEEARADGTMEEVDQGYEEGEEDNRRPVAGSAVVPR